MRSAEQRWPALWNAEATASRTACSGSAVESTIMALSPPVSAISMASGCAVAAICRSIRRATSMEPVKQTPAIRGSAVSASPAVPSPISAWTTSFGIPAWYNSSTARAAISGVCSADLATTVLPVTSAAAIWPVKIASGKFHGEMQAITPRARVSCSTLAACPA